jgi:hypothetical protein
MRLPNFSEGNYEAEANDLGLFVFGKDYSFCELARKSRAPYASARLLRVESS